MVAKSGVRTLTTSACALSGMNAIPYPAKGSKTGPPPKAAEALEEGLGGGCESDFSLSLAVWLARSCHMLRTLLKLTPVLSFPGGGSMIVWI
jgi:hypothetical protein